MIEHMTAARAAQVELSGEYVMGWAYVYHLDRLVYGVEPTGRAYVYVSIHDPAAQTALMVRAARTAAVAAALA